MILFDTQVWLRYMRYMCQREIARIILALWEVGFRTSLAAAVRVRWGAIFSSKFGRGGPQVALEFGM